MIPETKEKHGRSECVKYDTIYDIVFRNPILNPGVISHGYPTVAIHSILLILHTEYKIHLKTPQNTKRRANN